VLRELRTRCKSRPKHSRRGMRAPQGPALSAALHVAAPVAQHPRTSNRAASLSLEFSQTPTNPGSSVAGTAVAGCALCGAPITLRHRTPPAGGFWVGSSCTPPSNRAQLRVQLQACSAMGQHPSKEEARLEEVENLLHQAFEIMRSLREPAINEAAATAPGAPRPARAQFDAAYNHCLRLKYERDAIIGHLSECCSQHTRCSTVDAGGLGDVAAWSTPHAALH
jgi:hypothetical protein